MPDQSPPAPAPAPPGPPPAQAPPAPPPPPEHTLTGDFRTHENFHSRHLEHDHTLIVFRPPGYDQDQQRRYPVLYLHDGQNVFDKATSVGEEWRVDETALGLITGGAIEPLLIVGIYNTGEHRIDEYTPTADPEKKGGGKADQYGAMLVEEIKPFIDREYRTRPDRESTGLGGSSLGGLLTLHLGVRHSGVFSKLAALSPSIWWDKRIIVREVTELQGKLPLKIWLDAGTEEGAEVIADTRALKEALIAKGWVEGRDLFYIEAQGGAHNEASWAARVDAVLKFLYPRQG
jgi:predicted alpha/beta superfamily hydrolase